MEPLNLPKKLFYQGFFFQEKQIPVFHFLFSNLTLPNYEVYAHSLDVSSGPEPLNEEPWVTVVLVRDPSSFIWVFIVC